MIYLVSADHVVERHACRDAVFKVSEYKHADGHVSYYASAAQYGCSKTYSSPERAIQGMLAEHACTNIRIGKQQGTAP